MGTDIIPRQLKIKYMTLAYKLARKAKWLASPNPAVGAVIVKNNKIVSKGYTQPKGGPHAEAYAILKAKENLEGSDMYVTLEPCNFYGKNPPCSSLIIKNKIRRVFVGTIDYNPRLRGAGIKTLKDAGTYVEVGYLQEPLFRLNEDFFKSINLKKPFISVKYATSLDGKVALDNGEAKWITSKKARKIAHLLRAKHDAIMVGVNTIIKDNPKLTVRHIKNPPKQPIRIVLDPNFKTPLDSNILKDDIPTIIAVLENLRHKPELPNSLLPTKRILPVPPNNKGDIDLDYLMHLLYKEGIISILVEGGPATFAKLFDANLVDKVYAFISSKLLLGKNTYPIVGNTTTKFKKVSEAIHLRKTKIKKISNKEVLVEGYINLYPEDLQINPMCLTI